MVLQEYLEKNKGPLKNAFYLLDATEWFCLINQKDNSLFYKKFKTGLFSRIKCAIVYVDEAEATKAGEEFKNLSLYVTPPKSAIKYLIDEMEENEIDGVMFNNHYFLSLEELWEIYNSYMPAYFKETIELINEIEDKKTKAIQYMRAFLMLPSIYTLCFDSDNTYAMERKKGYQGEVANTIYLFNSREDTEKFIKEKRLDEEGIRPQCCKNYTSIKEIVRDTYNYVTIDGKHFMRISDLLNIENKVLGI